jgi:hypothetical protein
MKTDRDLIIGAGPIAEAVFGQNTPTLRRRIYDNSLKLPVFRSGTMLCARRSAIAAMFDQREKAAVAALGE